MNIKLNEESLKIIKNHLDKACMHVRGLHIMLGDKEFPSFIEIGYGSNQATQDLTKILSPAINGVIYGLYKNLKNTDIKREENGLDALINGYHYELKVSGANNGFIKQWTGNKVSIKTPRHILLGYSVDEYTVDGLFIAVIDLAQCKNSKWANGNSHRSSFSTLKIAIEDADKIHILVGEKKIPRKGSKYLQFIPQSLNFC